MRLNPVRAATGCRHDMSRRPSPGSSPWLIDPPERRNLRGSANECPIRPRRWTLEGLRSESCCAATPILERRRSASTFDRCGTSIRTRRLLRPPRPLGLRHLADHELARRNLCADVVELREAGVLLPLRPRLRHSTESSRRLSGPNARPFLADDEREVPGDDLAVDPDGDRPAHDLALRRARHDECTRRRAPRDTARCLYRHARSAHTAIDVPG